MITGSVRLSKLDWYGRGGFENTRLWRRMKSGVWHYYMMFY